MPNYSHYSFNNYGSGNVNVFVGDNYATPPTNSRTFNHGNINIGNRGGRGNHYFSYSTSGNDDPPEIQTADVHSFRLPLTRGGMPLRASNYINVRRTNSSVAGCYKIDRTLNASSGLLDLVRSQRSNVHLEALNGSINANIRLVLPDTSTTTSSAGKALLTASNQNGSTNIRVDPRGPRPPFRLVATSGNGSVTVHIPRSFHGPVNIQCTNGTIRVSREIKNDLIVLSDDFSKKCFIGDLAGYDGSAGTIQEGWDELSVDAGNGNIGICYADVISEVEEVDDDDIPPTYGATIVEEDDYYSGYNRTSTYSNGYNRTSTYSNPGGGVFNMIFGTSVFR